VNWKRAAIGMIATLPVIALFAFGFTRNPSEIPSPLPGNAAPNLSLGVFAPGESPLARNVGDTIRLADQNGKVVVVNFWASWCLACRDEHVALSETAREYPDKAQFIGVLYNDRPAAGSRWIAQMGGQSYPSVTDNDSRTAIDYGLYGVPETFIIDPQGRIAYKHLGPISAATLRMKIDSLLPRNAAGLDAPKADTVR
jgi:cytochrome c biogenesis protein CcmG, thiol:disulfide interchange protein DsbE